MNEATTNLIRVSATSSPFKAAGAIAALLRQKGRCSVQAIGAPALNQAMKALIYARRYLEEDKLDLTFVPMFNDVELEGATKTAIRFEVQARPRTDAPSEPPLPKRPAAKPPAAEPPPPEPPAAEPPAAEPPAAEPPPAEPPEPPSG